MKLDAFENLVRDWTQESGDLILRHFRASDLATEFKADASPVTLADREAELLLRQKIGERFPEHGILGEEFAPEREDAEYVWLIDPIDGTKSFVAGVPLFGTILCLQQNERPLLGAIHLPALQGQLLVGDGTEARLNGKPVAIRPPGPPKTRILLTSDERDVSLYQKESGWKRLLEKVAYCRTWGDCYGYYLLATGKADVMADPIVNPWDFHAIIPILEGARAKVTDWTGGKAVGGSSVVAASPTIHNEIIDLLNA